MVRPSTPVGSTIAVFILFILGLILFDEFFQHASAVVFFIVRRIHECDNSFLGQQVSKLGDSRIVSEFLLVTLLKLNSFTHIMAVPFAKLWTRGDFFKPEIDVSSLFG